MDISLEEFVFFKDEKSTIKHVFEVACGYHSKIVGEDQILGQLRDSYMESLKLKASSKELGRLFQNAISCGKKFKTCSKLYEIKVSSVSIVVSKLKDLKCKKVMVIGYGEIGKLSVRYLLEGDFETIYLVLRNKEKVQNINDDRLKILSFKEKNKYINHVDSIIGCTSAPHRVVLKDDINIQNKKLYCFDMAVPRDIQKSVKDIEGIELYNIDEISKIDDKNKKLRIERMKEYRYIVDDSINDFNEYLKIRNISKDIKEIKDNGIEVSKRRLSTYKNKNKGNDEGELVYKLINSVTNLYTNRAIEILKEEEIKGSGEECLRILKKIFMKEN